MHFEMIGTEQIESPPLTPAPATADQTRRFKLVVLVSLISLAYLVALVHYATVRPVDCAEVFNSTAARLVWQGKAPYRDFFFQQAPLLPYLYSWVWAVHPQSLVSMRLFSVACGGLATFFWGIWLLRFKRIEAKALIATFATLVLNPAWMTWNVVVKTYAAANLLMTVGTISLYNAIRSRKPVWYLVAGLGLGTCASTRSLYGPLIPVVALWLWYREFRGSEPNYRLPLCFIAGAAFGLLPMMVSFARDPHAFLFNNVHYHALQGGYVSGNKVESSLGATSRNSVGDILLTYFAVLVVLLMGLHPYFTLMLALGLIGAWSVIRLRKKRAGLYDTHQHLYFELSGLMLLVYSATALIPFPPFDQHFSTPLVPLLMPFVLAGVQVLSSAGRRWFVALAIAAPLLFVTGIGRDAWQYSREPDWKLSAYHNVAETIKAQTSPDDVVLSFWPGYVFESGRRYFPGLENNWGYAIMKNTSAADRARYHIVSNDDIVNAISKRSAALLITFPTKALWMSQYYNTLSPAEKMDFEKALSDNYFPVSTVDNVSIYKRRAPQEP